MKCMDHNPRPQGSIFTLKPPRDILRMAEWLNKAYKGARESWVVILVRFTW